MAHDDAPMTALQKLEITGVTEREPAGQHRALKGETPASPTATQLLRSWLTGRSSSSPPPRDEAAERVDDSPSASAEDTAGDGGSANAAPEPAHSPPTTTKLHTEPAALVCAAAPPPPAPRGLAEVGAPAALRVHACAECAEVIPGAIYMLNDRAYCCQRHRLVAYHKHERERKPLVPLTFGPSGAAEGTGLRASFGSWL